MPSLQIERFPDPDAAAEAAAAVMAAAVGRGGSLVVTGGRTPGPIYDRLAALPVDWPEVWVTLSDERWVDEASPASNARLVRERLLVGPASRARFAPLMGGEATPEAGAPAAEARLRALPRPFDLVLLGMGEDGHVASLFPGAPVGAGDALCLPVRSGGAEPRLSLTLRALLDARQVLIFATGRPKWEVLQAALGGADLPVTAILNGPAPVRAMWSP